MDLQTVLPGDLKKHDQSMGNIIILLGKVFIFSAISVEMLQIGRFSTLVRHSKMEGCIAKGNSKMALYWERLVHLWTSEGWS